MFCPLTVVGMVVGAIVAVMSALNTSESLLYRRLHSWQLAGGDGAEFAGRMGGAMNHSIELIATHGAC